MPTGSSIAAHVDHLRYGSSLMNRWSAAIPQIDRSLRGPAEARSLKSFAPSARAVS
jgi:hypothetical protein